MDLPDVLIDASVGGRDAEHEATLGIPALDSYYNTVFGAYLPAVPGQYLIRAPLHFAMQQLATRSRVRPEQEQYLQLGGCDAGDLAAALIQSMPHTRVTWLPGLTSLTAGPVRAAVDALRPLLPADGICEDLRIDDTPWRSLAARTGDFGFAAIFCDREGPDLEAVVARLGTLVHAQGRIAVFQILSGSRRPVSFADESFTGRYLMTGPGAMRTLAITLLPGRGADG